MDLDRLNQRIAAMTVLERVALLALIFTLSFGAGLFAGALVS